MTQEIKIQLHPNFLKDRPRFDCHSINFKNVTDISKWLRHDLFYNYFPMNCRFSAELKSKDV